MVGRVLCLNGLRCPKCSKNWPDDCEQSLCIERHGECIACRFVPLGDKNQHGSGIGTADEFDELRILRHEGERHG